MMKPLRDRRLGRTPRVPHAPRLERLEDRRLLSGYLPPSSYGVGSVPDFAVLADFNGDGKQDMAVSSYDGSLLSIRLGNGDGTFGDASNIPMATAPDYLAAADFNSDGRLDLITAHFDDNTVKVLPGGGNGTFAAPLSSSAGNGPGSFALGDFDGDGHTDLVIGKSFEKKLTILRGLGDGTFAAPVGTTIAITPTTVLTADFNNDGRIDIAASDYFTDQVALFLGNGNATFQSPTTFSVGAGPAHIASGDFNGDGKLDLATANFLGSNVSVLLGNGSGGFGAATPFAAGAGATYLVARDLNNDGNLDLAVANAFADSVSVLPGAGNGSFGAGGNTAVGELPRAIAVGQLNADSMPDLVVTNQGSNNVSVLIASGTSSGPTANAGGPYAVNEGATVALNGSGSIGTGLTYAWDLDGDGVFGETGTAATRGNETGATPTFNAAGLDGPASRTVWLRVTDSGGLSNTATAFIQVQNVAPTLTISGPNSANEGSTYTLTLSRQDPGPDTITRWVINWGDGTIQTINGDPSSATHVYADNGSYSISATATDEDGTWSSNTKLITIANVAPTLGISGSAQATAGSPYTLLMSSSDPGSDTIIRWTIDWGDGVVETITGNPSSATHTYATAGASYTISATATDEDGTWASNSFSITVASSTTDTVHPTASLLSAPNVTVAGGTTYEFTVLYSDNVGINTSFLDDNDLLVTGPNGFSQLAQFVSWEAVSPTSVVATYRIVPPGGSWDAMDSGSYTIAMRKAQVRDTTGNSVRTGNLGTFLVDLLPPDQAGNTLATALDYGGFYAGRIRAFDDYVGQIDRNDYVKITVTQPIILLGKLYNLTANADFMLLDGSGNRIIYPKKNGTNPEAFSRALSPGIYYIRVFYSISGGTTYRLRLEAQAPSGSTAPPADDDNSLATARDIGTLNPGDVRAYNDYIGADDRNDFYRFTVQQPTRVYIKLTELTDNADLMLMDSAGNRIAYSKRGGGANEWLLVDLAPGTYYARVLFAGTGGSTYRLRLEALVD